MKNKKVKYIISWILLFIMVFCTVIPENRVSAAENTPKLTGLQTVYLTTSGTYPSGDGSTKEKPLHDMKDAFDSVADGGTIVILGYYVDQAGFTTPAGKAVTIQGEDESVFLTLRYGITMGSDLKFDRIRLETTATDADARCFFVNGYSLKMTDSVQCYVNENDNQKAYIYAGSPDGTEISGRRAKIDVGGGRFAGIYGYGKGGAKVLEGSEITVRDNALTDRLDTASVVNIYSRQKLREAAQNIEWMNICAPFDTYNLFNVKNITLQSILTLTAENGTTLNGNLDMKGAASLDIKSDLYIKGELSGTGTITPWFRGQVVSGSKESAGKLTFENDVNSWEMRMEETESGIRWYAAPKNTMSVYYIDGTAGDDRNTGESADQAFASVQKALDTAVSGKAEILLIISGDTTVSEALNLSLPGHTLTVSGMGSSPAKLTVNEPLTIGQYTQFDNLNMDFTGCAGRDGIVIDGESAVFEDNLSMEGTPPDIRCIGGEGSAAQQIDIYSGTYGNIKGEDQEAFLVLHNGSIKGKISGWGYIDAAPEIWNNGEVYVGGGIESSGWVTLLGGADAITVDGGIQAESLETDGQQVNLKVTSASQINVSEFDPKISLTVLPKEETVTEGIYLTADSFVENTKVSRIRLKNTKGYIMPVSKSGDKYIGTLKAAVQLGSPTQIVWDTKGTGKLTWDKVPNEEKYLVTVWKGDEEVLTEKETSTESMDCSQELIRYGKGEYRAAVQAVSGTDEYSDSDVSYSGVLSYHIKAQSIVLSTNKKELVIGEKFQLKAKAWPNNAECGFQWTSSDASAADVDEEGNVTAVSPGTADIIAEADDGSGAAASCRITVKAKPVQKAEQIVLSQTKKTLYPGESFPLQADVLPKNTADRTVKWSSSNPKAVEVTSSGRITAKSEGRAAVTAQANDGSGIKAECIVTVAARTYSVRYILDGGRNHRDNPSKFANPPVRLRDPVKEGYLFAGWYTDAGFRMKAETISQKKDYILYAKWQKAALAAPKLTSMKNPAGQSLTVSYSRVSGAEGYEISVSPNAGFSKGSVKKWETMSVGKTVTGLKKNTVYYVRIRAYRKDSAGKKAYGAYSAKTKGYTVKYQLNKGKNHNANIISYYNIKVPLKNPSRKGYRFKGWYTTKKYKKRIKSIPKGKRVNYTLYAKWKKK
ncbi:Ig-like domain-containing protein [Anaerostipes sp.]|uniref:Ig-like domain-containing protein n=1 Tax=Anaerostipes sp. TaxID=1872530 RepID=UPI0025C2FE3A|nr:Ig-like domain-containing protein [Anaerostipes sp.]MBS7009559.1 Ig-like domain-containing protein [Anaerostipes sp.]